MIALFIDANIYLRFYAYTDDDLIELEKLHAMVEAGELKIYSNKQLVDEVERNIESKIKSALDTYKKSGGSVQIPRFALQFEEAKEVIALSKQLSSAKVKLSEKIEAELSEGDLRARRVIETLLSDAVDLKLSEQTFNKARWRQVRGHPPGKPDSIGDQIHWEALIEHADSGDLHIVSFDGDFSSKLSESNPNPVLLKEWKSAKSGCLYVYKSLSEFTKKHFESISLPSDVTKSSAINRLIISSNFDNTHKQIAKLQGVFDEITKEEAVILLQAMIDNSQINWISDDPDVKEFYKKLYFKFIFDTTSEMDKELDKAADYFSAPF